MNETVIEKQGYRLHMIQSNKFKTLHFVAKFIAPLSREDVTKRALLPFVMQQATENYPTSNAFRQKLDDLYGSTFSMDGSKKGEMHILTARMSVVNPSYLSANEPILEEAVRFFNEALFAPKVVADGFDPKIVAREKQSLGQKIDSIKDNKMQLANMRLIEEMCEGEVYKTHVHGYPEDFDHITPENLYQYYQQVMNEEPFDLYVIGDLTELNVEALCDQHIERSTNAPMPSMQATEKTVVEPKEIIEEEPIQQGKLHFGFRTHTHYSDDDYPALHVFNAIFGGFPSSKLFINVREKNSLAYYAASRFESHKGLLFVFSGIAPADFDKAKTIILEQLEAMRKGDFTDEQITEAKSLITNQYKENLDEAYGMVEMLYNQQFSSKTKTIDFVSNIEAVTKEAIVRVANRIELDTTYFLTQKGAE
nr:pitrilysin family protein [Halolactibacillus miurensis]